MHFLVALGIVLGPANTPVFVMRCPNVRKLQPRGRGHVVWKHAKNYACASFVLAIEGVGAPSFLRRYAADTVRGWFFFPVSRRVSRLVSGVSRENFNFCRKEKKKSHYPNVSLSECSPKQMPRSKYTTCLKFESAKNQVKRAQILVRYLEMGCSW